MAGKRQTISLATKRQVLTESGYMCGNPVCRNHLALDLHHIVRVAEGGSNEAANLIPLCPNCHARHTRGDFPQEAIEAWKQQLMLVSGSLARQDINRLLVLVEQARTPIYVSGDGLLTVASLLFSGLLEVISSQSMSGGGTLPGSAFRIQVTQVGEQLAKAWRQGDTPTVSAILTGRSWQ